MADAEQRRMMAHAQMDNFDLLTMSYPAQPLPGGLTSNGMDSMTHASLLPLDSNSNFDADTYAGSEDLFSNTGMPGQMPHLRRYPSTYEDHFSDAMSNYNQALPPDQGQVDGNEASIEGGHKLLSFSMPNYSYNLLDYLYRRTSLSITSQLHGMFFLAESPWAAGTDAASQPNELTCYRRNLFQISGTLTLPRGWRYIQPETGEQIPICGQELSISATESVEGNPVKIISVPWKTPAGNAPVAEDKTEKEPQPIPLDLMAGQELDETFVTFPISWKRLQFRIATANNGRRKELQQHFVIHIKLLATLTNGAKVSVCEITSGAVIVRGRSPRNFQSRRDIAISQSGAGVRNRATSSAQTGAPQPVTAASHASQAGSADPQSAPLDLSADAFFNDPGLQVSPDFFNWDVSHSENGVGGGRRQQHQHQHAGGAMTSVPPDFGMPVPNFASYARSSPDLARQGQLPRSAPAAPINLSLTEDEVVQPRTKTASPADPLGSGNSHHHHQHLLHRATPNKKSAGTTPVQRPPSFSLGLMSSPDESAELLYEYFPLSLGDWMPPVDAVYRPHVVHHMTVPQDVKTEKIKGRSKRYFSEG